MNEFWMLFADGQQAPIAKHPTIESAVQEASRIACRNHGVVYVLQAVKRVQPSPMVTVEDL